VTFGGDVPRGGAGSPGLCAGSQSLDARLWEGVSRLLDRAVPLGDLRSHRIELLALARWWEVGRPVPSELVAEARMPTIAALSAPALLQRVRESCDGPIVLLKGPEAAACYPVAASRPFGDLDVLVPDADAVQRALIAAGFKPLGEEGSYLHSHQLQPLHYPGFPLVVEVHVRPHWVEGIQPPPVDKLFEMVVESVVPVTGISALPRTHHAVLLAVHAWAHEPLGNLRDLIDVAAALQGTSVPDADALARAWGVERIWHTTVAAVDALLFGKRRAWPLRIWARHLGDVRERTVLETHLERWFAAFSAFPPGRAALMGLRAMGSDVHPNAEEGWPTKVQRTRRAIKNAFEGRSRHDGEVEGASTGGRLTGVEDSEYRG
jgi:Uncharacterised nucleotidyltransferase